MNLPIPGTSQGTKHVGINRKKSSPLPHHIVQKCLLPRECLMTAHGYQSPVLLVRDLLALPFKPLFVFASQVAVRLEEERETTGSPLTLPLPRHTEPLSCS